MCSLCSHLADALGVGVDVGAAVVGVSLSVAGVAVCAHVRVVRVQCGDHSSVRCRHGVCLAGDWYAAGGHVIVARSIGTRFAACRVGGTRTKHKHGEHEHATRERVRAYARYTVPTRPPMFALGASVSGAPTALSSPSHTQ
eukprot:scaffold6621_cov112-Isochrysis_galbana.AAC.3